MRMRFSDIPPRADDWMLPEFQKNSFSQPLGTSLPVLQLQVGRDEVGVGQTRQLRRLQLSAFGDRAKHCGRHKE